MNTAEFINWVLKRTGRQATVEEVRVLVNSAQNVIFSYNTTLNKKKPESACFLNTTLGISQYTISDKSIRQISRVFYYDGDNEKVDVPAETTQSLNTDDNVIVYFKDDPGTTTKEYYYDAYVWPQNGQITSTSIPLSVPEKVQLELLFYMVSKMLEVDKDGRSIYNKEEVDEWINDYFNFANQGADTEPTIPNDQGYS
jgi:hypothetical protein